MMKNAGTFGKVIRIDKNNKEILRHSLNVLKLKRTHIAVVNRPIERQADGYASKTPLRLLSQIGKYALKLLARFTDISFSESDGIRLRWATNSDN